ncbi:MAG: methionine--tRNA ligase subunit beta [Planctomycetes bacterium]|nr:methionine--tRNA ligase subunit beta [Planctomycetota bacterium]
MALDAGPERRKDSNFRSDTRQLQAEETPLPGERISLEEFQKIDLRVGVIREAERIPGANKLLHLSVDCGGATIELVSGIAPTYDPAELPGKRIVVITNLEPARIRGVESQGMLLAAQDGEGRLSLVTLDREVASGARVS